MRYGAIWRFMTIKFASSPIVPDSAYSAANNELAMKLNALEDLVANLRNRLATVLGPEQCGKSDECGSEALRAQPAPLVSALEHHAAHAERISGEVSDLLRRLCL